MLGRHAERHQLTVHSGHLHLQGRVDQRARTEIREQPESRKDKQTNHLKGKKLKTGISIKWGKIDF